MPVTPSSLIAAVDREQLEETNAGSSARLELLGRFALITDPRSRRGRRHSLVSALAVVACATAAVGGDSLTAIEQWADNAPQQVLADLKVWRDPLTGRVNDPPSTPITTPATGRRRERTEEDHYDRLHGQVVPSSWQPGGPIKLASDIQGNANL
ncbi:transposase family protein [Streptosporangium sp. NBC_01755]|uniref:transposase family protein n=1 Tax=Streptosporangium sp. NBC_01755 TaxID=2975949 RepID=UPI002DD9681B|nr:transposase family protein [Streptosporangium sp. NBC_01755]WSD01156.1 transposase family protein [Streptosporangium sp. NBC_01755]